jgi:hypothetical protein
MVSVDDQAADHDERFGIHIISTEDVHPPNSAAIEVGDEKLLIVPEQDA